MQKGKDYIIYIGSGLRDDYEVWALNPRDETPILVLTGIKLWSEGWSPSGKQWLLSGRYTLYVANADGTGIRSVFQSAHLPYLRPIWVSESEILVNAYSESLLQRPEIYSINVETGGSDLVKIDGVDFVQTTFIKQGIWIGSDWNGSLLQLIDQQSKATPILNDYAVSLDPYGFFPIQSVTGTADIIFVGNLLGSNSYGLRQALLSNSEVQTLFEADEGGSILDFHVSPDGKSIGFVYRISEDLIFKVVDINSKHLTYQWPFPYTIGPTNFRWSPDGKYIALYYSAGVLGSGSEISSGIQIMDITTGKIRVLLNKDTIGIVDWIDLE